MTINSLLREANAISDRIDIRQGDMDSLLSDRPTKIVLKSARGKLERLFTSLSHLAK